MFAAFLATELGQFLTAPENIPFAIAICLMLGIAVIEGILMLIGFSFSDIFDTFLPHVDADVDHSSVADALGWLEIGKVPTLMLLVIFLTAFGMIGYGLQYLAGGTGYLLNPVLASGISFLPSLFIMKSLGRVIAKVIPRDETYAVSSDEFIGKVATITMGTATRGNAARGKVIDHLGHAHNVLVEPDERDEEFKEGEEVLLVSKDANGVKFKAVANIHEALQNSKE